MAPQSEASPFDTDRLGKGKAVFDTIYNPQRSALIRAASSRGCNVASGVDMFVAQAALQFREFTGLAAPQATMRRAVIDALNAGEGMS